MSLTSVVLKGVQSGRTASSAAGACISARQKHTLRTGEAKHGFEQTHQPRQKMHQVVASHVGVPSSIPMPPNVEELQASEKARFSPRRTRDTSSAHIATKVNQIGSVFSAGFMGSQGAQGSNFNRESLPVDTHLDVYDSANAVSLSSVMQTNVPKPFGIKGKAPVHLNMPGGQWAQDDKYVSGDLQQHHHSTITSGKKPGIFCSSRTRPRFTWCASNRVVGPGSYFPPTCHNHVFLINNPALYDLFGISQHNVRFFHACDIRKQSGGESPPGSTPETQLSSKERLQRLVKQYGTTVIVFHVTISLASLGLCYLLVSSGVDLAGYLQSMGIKLNFDGNAEIADAPTQVDVAEVTSDRLEGEAEKEPQVVQEDIDVAKTVAGAATFLVAYAVHKVFAPLRLAITFTAAPFIVRHLRKVGFLKAPKQK